MLLAMLGVLAGGCGIGSVPVSPPPAAPIPPPRTVATPTDCTQSPATSAEAQRALAAADPGQKVCLLGRYAPDTVLSLTRSGTSSQPIVLESNGVTLGGIDVAADNVVVRGFNLWGGGGINAQGQHIAISDNDVRDAALDGIRCAPCTDAQINGNTVIGADGIGIMISGETASVRDNDVSQSPRRGAPDADGIGFAGTNLTIQHNYVHDIYVHDFGASGYPPDQAPRADCLRTEDSPGQASAGVSLSDNVCANVAGACLTADGAARHGASVPDGEQGLRFVGNYCQSGSQQAVELVAYPDAVVQRNTFAAGYRTAVLATRGSTGVTVTDNTLVGDFPPFEADATSMAGLEHSGNVTR
jgi:Right handed beta helix region